VTHIESQRRMYTELAQSVSLNVYSSRLQIEFVTHIESQRRIYIELAQSVSLNVYSS